MERVNTIAILGIVHHIRLRVSEAIELHPKKYIMPKILSNDRINAAFEEIAEALNNPKLRKGFLNGNKENEIINELVEVFDKQKKAHKSIAHVRARVNHTPNTNKIVHVPARVNPNPVPIMKIDRRPRLNHNPNKQKIAHVLARGEPMCDRTPAEMQIPPPLSHFPNGIFIYKLFNKKYLKATVIHFNKANEYYTVRYDDNDEEELTHEEIKEYLISPEKEEYWTKQQSGRRRSKQIEKIKFTRGYAGAVRALDPTWYNLHKQSEQEYKHLASTIIDEETGRRLEYRHLIEHQKFRDDWLKSGANEFYRIFQGSKK